MTKHDERQETIKLCLRNAIDWEGVGNHKSAAFWRNVASEIQTVEALTAENERLREAVPHIIEETKRIVAAEYEAAMKAMADDMADKFRAALAGKAEQ